MGSFGATLLSASGAQHILAKSYLREDLDNMLALMATLSKLFKEFPTLFNLATRN